MLALLLLGATLLQLAFLHLPMPADPVHYYEWAANLDGIAAAPGEPHGQTRLGVIVPVYLAQQVLGISELTFYLVPFLLHLVLVGSTYVVGARLFGQAVGVIGAVLLAGSVLVLEGSSQIFPDTFGAAWFTLAVALLLLGGDRTGGRRLALLAAGTLACGLAYLCRENIVVLAPVVLLLAWRQRWRWRDWAVVVATAAAVLLVELVGLWLLFGDPLARFHAVTSFGAGSERLAEYGRGATVRTVLTRTPDELMEFRQGVVLIAAVLLTPVLALVGRRAERPAWQLLTVWFFAFWAVMMWSAGIFDPTEPRVRDFRLRYWLPVFPAVFLAVAAATTSLVRLLPRRASRPVLAATCALLLVPFLVDLKAFTAEPEMRVLLRPTDRDAIRHWFTHRSGGVHTISTDARTAMLLPFLTRPFAGGPPTWDGRVEIMLNHAGDWAPVERTSDAGDRGAVVLFTEDLRWTHSRLPPSYRRMMQAGRTDLRRPGESVWIVRPR